MKHRPRFVHLRLLLFALTGAAGTAASFGKSHFSLHRAILHARPGDTIKVPAGIYTNTLSITKPLRIVGRGAVLKGKCLFPLIRIRTPGKVTLSGFQIVWESDHPLPEGSSVCSVSVEAGNVRFERCRFQSPGAPAQSPCALFLQGENADVTLFRCRFQGFETPIQVWDKASLKMQGCLVQGAGATAVLIGSKGFARIDRCVVTAAGECGIRCSGGRVEAVSSWITDCRTCGIYIGNRWTEAIIRDCIFRGNGTGVQLHGPVKAEVRHCVLAGNREEAAGFETESHLYFDRNVVVNNGVGIRFYLAGGKRKLKDVNLFFGNGKDAEGVLLPKKTLRVKTDCSKEEELPGCGAAAGMGPKDPKTLYLLWKAWKSTEAKPAS